MDWAFVGQVLGVISAVLAIIAAAYTSYRWYISRSPTKVSWRRVERGVLRIIHDLRRDNFVPDLVVCVVCIGRSGAIFGGLIAGNMGNVPIALLDRRFQWDKGRVRDDVPLSYSEVHIDDSVRRVLVVIGEIYSGSSIKESLGRLEGVLNGREYRLACLNKVSFAPVKVDYCVYEVEKPGRPPWVISNQYARPGL